MKPVKVKICGITNLEDALVACEAGADALGFVFAPEAKKRNSFIEPEKALEIIEQLPPFVTTVAVCVNESLENIVHYLAFVDCVQMQGDEPPDLLPFRHLGIKAFRVGPDFDVLTLLPYKTRAWLLDASVPGEHGGTGRQADWDMARLAVTFGTPVILSGGLTPENVAEAIRYVKPYGVDVSSGVEAEPGRKDHERVRDFIRIAKTCLA